MFGTEMLVLDMTIVGPPPSGGGSPRLVRMRESPFQASLGQLVVTSTNNGFFVNSFVDLSLKREGPNFGQWTPAMSLAHVELSGPPGVPAVLSVSQLNATTAMICWSTQTNGQYQLQRNGSVEGGTWTDVGAALAGTSSNVCVIEAISAAKRFYRVRLSP